MLASMFKSHMAGGYQQEREGYGEEREEFGLIGGLTKMSMAKEMLEVMRAYNQYKVTYETTYI